MKKPPTEATKKSPGVQADRGFKGVPSTQLHTTYSGADGIPRDLKEKASARPKWNPKRVFRKRHTNARGDVRI
jgi:hypothetical protein